MIGKQVSFVFHLQDVDPEKFKYILKFLPSYYRKLEDKSCDKIDIEIFRHLIRKVKGKIYDTELLIKYELFDSENGMFYPREDRLNEFRKVGCWYNILYGEDYQEV